MTDKKTQPGRLLVVGRDEAFLFLGDVSAPADATPVEVVGDPTAAEFWAESEDGTRLFALADPNPPAGCVLVPEPEVIATEEDKAEFAPWIGGE